MVKLYFDVFQAPELAGKIPDCSIIRLLALCTFRTRSGWSSPRPAILDTGAPVSVIPLSAWAGLKTDILGEHIIRGIVPKRVCALPVKIGRLDFMIVDDEGNLLGPHPLIAFLADTDDVPLLLGFKDSLTRFRLTANYETREAALGD